MSIIFISGPMSGMPDFNRDAFALASALLRATGHTVLNPGLLPDGLKYGHYLKICTAMLECADTIYLLDGWENSTGATAEHALAKSLNLEISTPESRKGGAS